MIVSSPTATSRIERRLIQGVGASAVGPIVNVLSQVVCVPIFLYFWGASIYGEWVILSTIPTYIAVSDIGFGNVAANDMTIRVASGDEAGALQVFQSIWLFLCILSAVGGVAIAGVLLLLPVKSLFNFVDFTNAQLRGLLFLLSLYGLISLQNTIIFAGFRCDGRFAYGTLVWNLSRLAESLAVVGAVIAGGGPITVAATLVVTRLLGTTIMGRLMRKGSACLRFGTSHASLNCVKAIVVPAFAFMAIPAANAISLQGMVTVLGGILSPSAVAAFSTMRMLARFPLLMVEALKNSVWAELSTAYGAEKPQLAIRLHRHACQAALMLAAIGVLSLLCFGPMVYGIWTHGRLEFQPILFYLLVGVVLSNSLWNVSSAVALARNRHQGFAMTYLCTSIGSVGLAAMCVHYFGINGAAACLLIIDLFFGLYVILHSLASLGDSLRDFLRAIFDFRPLVEVMVRQSGLRNISGCK